jgi:hypothetical protein
MKLIIEDFDVSNEPGAYAEVHVNLYGPVQADGKRSITTCKAMVEKVLEDDTILTVRDPKHPTKVITRLDPGRPKKDEV